MAVVECPKCGRAAEEGAIICPGCDYILDASFLGDDITDDERDRRPRQSDAARRSKSPETDAPVDFGEDAMILGNLDDAEVSSFRSRDAGVSQREVTQTRFYIGGAVAQLMEPDAIPELAAGVSGASIRMTPFERHVLGFVNGRRSVGRIQKKSAMEETEFKTAVAMLADKGFIRLKGWKKPRPSGAAHGDTVTGASRSGSARRPPSHVSQVSQAVMRPPEGERTVVVSMDHIEAMAKQPASARASRRKDPASTAPASTTLARGGAPAAAPPPEADSLLDTPVAPMPTPPATDGGADDAGFDDGEAVTRVGGSPTLSSPVSPLPSRRFASLQAGVPDSAGESSARQERPLPAEPLSETADFPADAGAATPAASEDQDDPLAAAAAAVWDADDNQSSVFADSSVKRRPTRPPSLADAAAEDDDDGDAFASSRRDPLEALRDPTGMGDAVGDGDDVGSDGAPIGDDGDDGDDGGDDDAPFVSAEALGVGSRVDHPADADDDDDVPATDAEVSGASAAQLEARRIHDEVTGSLPQPAPPADDADDFALSPPTSHVPRPMTLPSEALSPIVVEPPRPAAVVAPVVAPAVEPAPAVAVALPGQAILKPGDAGFSQAPPAPAPPATPTAPTLSTAKPAAPTRVSASSQVPFELRKKAERIYEQAIKDQAEGRISSAMMNAKLAMNFDPTVDAYRELHDELARQKAAPKVGAARPQELILFEQASDAEGRGDYQKAVKLLEQAIAINPRAAALHNRIGVVLSIRLKRHEEALAHLKTAIELEPGSIVYMNNFSKVTGLLESVIEKGPRKKGGHAEQGGQVAVKKIRPKMF